MAFTPYGLFETRARELMKQVSLARIRYLCDLAPDATVRLYSYQGEAAWEAAQQRGYWTGSDHIWEEEGDWGFGPAYDWMREQMAARLPIFSGDYPMWGWTKRPSAKPKPRRYRGTSETIRLTVDVPRARILFSDYDAWHCVLNRNPVAFSETEYDEFATRFPDHWSHGDDAYREAYFAAIRPTWERVLSFNSSTSQEMTEWYGYGDRFHVQACVDRFQWGEIVGVRRFPEIG